MPLTRCPGCSQELDVDTQWLGELVRCDACQTEFTATAANEHDQPRRPRSDDADRPRRRRPAYDDYDDEPRPRRRRRPKKTSAGKVLLIIGGAALVIILGCAGLIAFSIHAATEDAVFAPNDWQLATLSDGKTTALFPGKPDHTIQPGLATVDTYTMAGDDYNFECAVCVTKFDKWTAPTFEKYTKSYETALQTEIDGTNFIAKPGTYQGYQSLDFTCDAAFDEVLGRIVYVPGTDEDTYYVGTAMGLNLGDADRRKFLNSLTIAKPNKP